MPIETYWFGDPIPSDFMYGGHCCACTGVCHHIGGPYLCRTHSATQQSPYYVPIDISRACEHCFCKKVTVNKKEHVECCNCGIKKIA